MRKALMIPMLAVGLLLSLSTQAQMRGGSMGGGRGAIGHGPVASARGRTGPGMPAGRFGAVPSGSRVVANNGRFINGRFGVNNHTVFVNGRRNCFNGFNCRNRFFFNSAFLGFPGFGWGYNYIPGFYPSDYSQEPQPAQQPVVVSNDNEGNTQLAVEIQRLSDEIGYMRQQQAQSQARPGASLSAHSAETTTFVFHDGRRMTTENYAIAGQTLWLFNERVAKKYSISELDRSATEQANAENGVDIRLPEP
jgi:hypothetical protein